MKNTIIEQQFAFQVKGIELLDLKLNMPEQPLPVQNTFHFNINLEQRINTELKLIIVMVAVDVLNEDKKTLLASMKASCIFEVANIDEFLTENAQQVALPDNILVMLNSVSISTIRGLMFAQFKGTFLHNAILPIIDPNSFIKNVFK